MIKLIGKVIKLAIKLGIIALIGGTIYCAIYQRDILIHQYNKVRGMYYVYLGDKAYKSNEMYEAISLYKRGLDYFPSHYGAWSNLGNLYVAYEDYFQAAEAYKKAIFYKSNYTLARMNLGIITAERLGNFDDAIEQYQAVINKKNKTYKIPFIYNNEDSEKINRAFAYYNMGHAYTQKAMYLLDYKEDEKRDLIHKAINAYKNAKEILPDNYEIRYNLALNQQIVGDYRNAGANYCRATELSPMQYEAHYNLGILLKEMNQISYSVDELEKAAVLSTGKIASTQNYIFDALNNISIIAIAKGDDKIDNKDKDKKKDDDKSQPEEEVVLVNGKITPTEETDLAILKNFGTCKSKILFEDN